jgi:hypothetical protein
MTKHKMDTKELQASLERAGAVAINLLTEQVFEVDGCPNCTIKKDDGSFRKMAIMAGWEFFVKGCYVGQRGSLIFQFEPVDTQPFEIMETSMQDIDTVFPLLGPKLADIAKATEGLAVAFSDLKTQSEKFRDVFGVIVDGEQKIEEAARKKALDTYSENPNFGMF